MAAAMTLCSYATLLTDQQEYYIWLNIYEKLLGSSEDGDTPAISAYGTNDSLSYVFIAENSGKNGYVLLKQKSTGRYLAASSSSNYGVVFEASRKTDDRFCWQVDEGTYTYLVNKKNSTYLGVDGAHKGSSFVSVYYDKPKGSHSQFSVIPTTGTTWDEARAAYVSEEYTNEQGVKEIDYCLVKDLNIDRSDAIDIHITANTTPIQGSSVINLGSDSTWLVIDNIAPSEVISTYLKYVKIKGKKASNGSNCRVAIFLNGAAVIPTPSTPMLCQSTEGEIKLAAGSHTDLSRKSNTITSFKLRRGYMATVATGKTCTGYSRVYVADHADLEVVLPTALSKRISSVYIKPWQYMSKKGWGSTGGSYGGSGVRATWYWSWSAGYSSTNDMEFVPCRQHLYWPSASDVNNKTATAALSLNEPEHSEQHTSDKCSCGGTINEWSAYKINSDFLAGGGRIGSPQPTDFSYLTNYCDYIDGMASRCDFVVTHAYWDLSGRSATNYANWFVDQCKTIWNNTGRPVWLTEMEISASWNTNKVTSYEQNRQYIQVLLQKLEESPWVERYCLYGTDMWQTYIYYEANASKGLTPAGQVYRDHRSTFAYNSKYTKTPAWWAPSVKTPSLNVKPSATEGKVILQITNPNTDMTDRLVVERRPAGGDWTEFYEVTDRWRFENEAITISGVEAGEANLDTDEFRVTVTTLTGVTVNSSSASSSLILNPTIVTDKKTSVDGWTCERDADNGYTKSTGDTYFEVWDATAANINFNYYQDIEELDNGIYTLSANVFNSSNGKGEGVNGAVGLYAQTSDQLYFAPVTIDDTLKIENVTTIERIVVTGGKLRIGIRNLGTMNGRWAGADNFVLTRVGSLNGVDLGQERTIADIPLYQLMPSLNADAAAGDLSLPRDASRFIVNPDANRKDSYGWTASNVELKQDAESYDANASNIYWNIWKSGAYESSLTQEINGLPEGSYTFSAMLRGHSTAVMTLTASTSETNTQQQSFTGVGNVDGDYPQGWNLVTTPAISVKHGETLKLNFTMASSATAWWSADHFQLTLTDIPQAALGITPATLNEGATGKAPLVYDLQGRCLGTSGSARLNAGIYIIGGRKVIIR